MEIKIQSLDQIHEAARQFIAEMGDNTVFALYGNCLLYTSPSPRDCS